MTDEECARLQKLEEDVGALRVVQAAIRGQLITEEERTRLQKLEHELYGVRVGQAALREQLRDLERAQLPQPAPPRSLTVPLWVIVAFVVLDFLIALLVFLF